jgi:hypothetical protein
MKRVSISENHLTGMTFLSIVTTVLIGCLNSATGMMVFGLSGLIYSSQSKALSCGSYNGTICNGTATQGGLKNQAQQF